MAVIKNKKTGMWEVRTYYKDLTGERKQKTKRGFAKKNEALEWERNFKLKENQSISMSFKSFVDIYLTDLEPRIKRNTFLTKKHIIETKIKEMEFWTQEKFQKFLERVADKPISYYAFEMLYWTGIREGELLALTPVDFNFEKKTLRINKSYQRLEGEDVITDPKTPKSNRTIVMPDFLAIEMEDFIKSIYGIKMNDRIAGLYYPERSSSEGGCHRQSVDAGAISEESATDRA